MSWNKEAAVSHLRSRALGRSHNECATFTREAIAAGGIRLERTLNAKDYGQSLLQTGYRAAQPAFKIYRMN